MIVLLRAPALALRAEGEDRAGREGRPVRVAPARTSSAAIPASSCRSTRASRCPRCSTATSRCSTRPSSSSTSRSAGRLRRCFPSAPPSAPGSACSKSSATRTTRPSTGPSSRSASSSAPPASSPSGWRRAPRSQRAGCNAYLERALDGRAYFNGDTFGWGDLAVDPVRARRRGDGGAARGGIAPGDLARRVSCSAPASPVFSRRRPRA